MGTPPRTTSSAICARRYSGASRRSPRSSSSATSPNGSSACPSRIKERKLLGGLRKFCTNAHGARLGRRLHFVHAMYEFTQLLIRASQTLGTVLGVANLLEVDPRLVYRWIAGFERPEPARRDLFG